VRIRFEGEFNATWAADLLLLEPGGPLRRVPIALSDEGHGEITVPLGGIGETWLLVRNLGSEDGAPRRYSYSAHLEVGYPFEIATFDVTPAEHSGKGVGIHWETRSERELIGFNILRVREDGGQEVVVNPVWIPALGEPDEATSYDFFDSTARPGIGYLYRIQGITKDGLSSLSDPVVVRP
jgi:hypothetical protein